MSNSNDIYATVVQADSYWEHRSEAWAGATSDQKQVALRRASEWIDTSFLWIGSKATSGQRLQWPRTGAVDSEGFLRSGDEIPPELADATCWLAAEALASELDVAQPRGGDIRRVQAGSVQVEWNAGAPTGKAYRHVKRMIRSIIEPMRLRRG